jgi:hypothetical protein
MRLSSLFGQMTHMAVLPTTTQQLWRLTLLPSKAYVLLAYVALRICAVCQRPSVEAVSNLRWGYLAAIGGLVLAAFFIASFTDDQKAIRSAFFHAGISLWFLWLLFGWWADASTHPY